MLSDASIKLLRWHGTLAITPWRDDALGPNSYDVTLAKRMACFASRLVDVAEPPVMEEFVIPDTGFLLEPGILYLGVVQEHVRTPVDIVPDVDGRSSVARCGLSIHCTAGRGDAGYAGHFTLEMWCVQPIRIYAGMPIGQLYFSNVVGEVERPYGQRSSSSYQDLEPNPDPRPIPSALWRKFQRPALLGVV